MNISSGVPQESVLDPLLFVLYINDLPENITSHSMKLYADDSKIIGIIKSTKDSKNLQTDIDKAVEWSHKWQMKLYSTNAKLCIWAEQTNLLIIII